MAEMGRLERNWDGDCAVPPTGPLIASVIELAEHLKSKDGLPPTRVSPIVDGGIALEWQVGDEFYHVEFLTPDIAELFTSIPGTKPEYEEIDFCLLRLPTEVPPTAVSKGEPRRGIDERHD